MEYSDVIKMEFSPDDIRALSSFVYDFTYYQSDNRRVSAEYKRRAEVSLNKRFLDVARTIDSVEVFNDTGDYL